MSVEPARPPHAGMPRIIPLKTGAVASGLRRWLLLGTLVFLLGNGLAVAALFSELTVANVVPGTGSLEASRSRTVRAPFAARLIELLVEGGGSVTMGQVVARLDDRDLLEELTTLDHDLRIAQWQHRQRRETRMLEFSNLELDDRVAEMDLAEARSEALVVMVGYLGHSVDIDSLLANHTPGLRLGIDQAVNGIRRVEARLRALAIRRRTLEAEVLDSLQSAERILALHTRRRILEEQIERAVLRGAIVKCCGLRMIRQRPPRPAGRPEGRHVLSERRRGTRCQRARVAAKPRRSACATEPVPFPTA